MGALKGSISYTKFHIRGEVPEDFRERFMERIKLRTFRPLVAADEAEQGVGWCSIEDPLDLQLDHGKVFYNDYLNLGMRIDRWQIPGLLFKARFAEAEREVLAKKGREKLGKRERDELKVTVSRKLRAQVFPAMKVIDLSWNLQTGVVRFWNQSTRVHESLHELFEDTFSLDLVPESPFTAAARLDLSSALSRALETLLPTSFAAA